MVLMHSSRFFLSDVEEVVEREESGFGVCFGLTVFGIFCGGKGVGVGDVKWSIFRFFGGNGCFVAATFASSAKGGVIERGCRACYSSFDLSSIYAVKYHLTTRIRLYQLSFLISTIPGPRYRFPAFSDLPVI